MITPLEAFATALVATFTAELGDKTQLAILWLAETHRPWPLWLASVLAFGASVLLASLLGAAAGEALRGPWLGLLSGLVFLVFGVHGILSSRAEEPEDRPEAKAGSLIATVFAVVFLAELGDKTQIATALFASGGEPVWAALGSFVALALSSAMAVVLGRLLARLGQRARRALRLLGAVVFCAVGVYQIVGAITTWA